MRKLTPTAPSLSLPNIAKLVTRGKVSIEMLLPIGCVAIADDVDDTLAILVRRKGETLIPLLTRLDQAIAKAFREDVFTDETSPKHRSANLTRTFPSKKRVSISPSNTPQLAQKA